MPAVLFTVAGEYLGQYDRSVLEPTQFGIKCLPWPLSREYAYTGRITKLVFHPQHIEIWAAADMRTNSTVSSAQKRKRNEGYHQKRHLKT
jgi:hypothetical protein